MPELSFEYFDELYGGHSDQYIEMLELYCSEYADYKKGLLEALHNCDIERFRKIKHKLIYSLHLLSLNQFRSKLDSVAMDELMANEHKRDELASEFETYFQDTLQQIMVKRETLSTH